MKVITIALQKGGTSKTTTANSLAVGLKNQGFNVLTIDLDPQGNLSQLMGGNPSRKTAYEVITGKTKIDGAIQHTPQGDLLPASPLLAQLDVELLKDPGKEFNLLEALANMKANYDYVIIDTPPAISIQLSNALTVSDYVIITVQADNFSLQGLDQISITIGKIQKRTNKNLKILGILVSRYQKRLNVDQIVLEDLETRAGKLNTIVFKTKIRNCAAIKEAQIMGQDIFAHAPKSNAARDYNNLTKEVIELTAEQPKTKPKKTRKG